MIDKIEIKERGPLPRARDSGGRFLPAMDPESSLTTKGMNAAKKEAWRATAMHFHAMYIPRRFTAAHGREAGYSPRKGQDYQTGAKGFFRTYFGRKLRLKGHGDPFVWSGGTRQHAKFASISATSSAGVVRLPSARKLNFHPKLANEFRRILPREQRELGEYFDKQLDAQIEAAANANPTTTVITP